VGRGRVSPATLAGDAGHRLEALMRITLAQTTSRLGEVDANCERAAEIIIASGRDGSDLVVFPELFLSGYALGQVDEDVSMSADDPRLTLLSAIAPDTDVLVGFYEDGLGVHSYNAASYYSGGKLVHTHRKLYLPTYDIFEERKHFSPGQSMRAYDGRHGRFATLICNDAWQPHLAFLAVQDGARVLFVPTNSAQSRFPEQYDSRTYWQDITVFYARMYECFVVFCNRVGAEGEHLRFWGGSHIVDPWGKIICALPEEEAAVVTTQIDLSMVRKRRREVPLVREARLGLLAREATRLAEEGGDL
jgi:predicted amidohydrolase